MEDISNIAGRIRPFLVSLFIVFGMALGLVTSNAFTIFLSFFILSMSFTALLKSCGEDRLVRKFWIYSFLVDLTFLVGVVLLFGASGQFEFIKSPEWVTLINRFQTGPYFKIGVIFIVAALTAKVSVVPLHWWTVDWARLSSPLTSGIFLIFSRAFYLAVALKILAPLAALWNSFLGTPITVISVVTMIWASVMALRTENFRSLLCYSTLASTGAILSLFPILGGEGGSTETVILWMIAAFVITNSGLLVLMALITSGEKKDDDFASLEGLGWNHPIIGVCGIFFLLGLAGLPPFVGFFSKLMMLKEFALYGNYGMLAIVGGYLAAAVYYSLRPLSWLYGVRPLSQEMRDLEIGFSWTALVILTLFLSLSLGLFPSTVLQWITRAAAW